MEKKNLYKEWTLLHIGGEMSEQVLLQEARDNDFHERNIMTEHTKLYTALGRIRELSLVTSTTLS